MVRLLFLDGLLIFVAGAVLAMLAVTRAPGSGWSSVLGVAAAAALVLAATRFSRKGFGDGGALQAPRAHLIRDLLSVPFVVMGHSHAARMTPLGSDGLFFNTGSWVEGTPMHVRIVHAHAAGPDQRPRAELLPWTRQ